jgi:hypothetical protein
MMRPESAAKAYIDTVSRAIYGKNACKSGVVSDLFPSRPTRLMTKADNYKEPPNLTLFKDTLLQLINDLKPRFIVFIAPSSARIITPHIASNHCLVYTPSVHGSCLSDNRTLTNIREECADDLTSGLSESLCLGKCI